jgi:hypothetical protein
MAETFGFGRREPLMTYDFIPSDVLAYAKKRQFRRRLICLILFAAILLLGAVTVFLYWDFFAKAEKPNLVIIGGLYLFALFMIPNFPFALRNQSYIGEIEHITVSTVPMGKDPLEMRRNNSLMHRKFENHVILTVKLLDRKKEVLRQVATFHDKHYSKVDEFHEGDIVYYLDGTHHVFLFPKKESDRRLCVICGLTNLEGETVCRHCGHTLVGATADEVKENIG